MIRKSKLILAGGILTIAVAGGVAAMADTISMATPPATQPGGKNEKEKHPEIRRALMGLREAKNALEKADHDFDGHRKAAVEDTEKAIKECEEALKVK